MAILCPVEAKSVRGRLLHGGIIVALIVGGAAMVYPFLLMLSGSLRSPMDQSQMNLVPAFLIHRDALTRKFFESKYNQQVDMLNRVHESNDFMFRTATLPDQVIDLEVKDLKTFWRETKPPHHWQVLGAINAPGNEVPANLRKLQQRLQDKYQGDVAALSRDLGTPLTSWLLVRPIVPDWPSPRVSYGSSPVHDAYFKLMDDSPLAQRWLVSLSGYFLEQEIYVKYGKESVQKYNAAHVHDLTSYHDFRLPRRVPGADQPALRKEWTAFVREDLNVSFIRLEGVGDAAWRDFLKSRYPSIEELNRAWETHLTSWSQVTLPPPRVQLIGEHKQNYRQFLLTQPVEKLTLVGPEYAWADWLKHRYGDIKALNAAYQTQYKHFADVRIPIMQLEQQYVNQHATSLRWGFATRNYVNVFDQILFQGRALVNTVIFVSLAIFLALLINPMAAYAMSRFQLPGTYKILLILMATVAFPPMVAMIPQFIALRNLGLLNTFIALVLPLAVNGYLIFLLKGFFDSLPPELYEAARIDGASEMRMFFQITMALSKPILAVVALGAFNASYMMFLYALIVAPSENMWILSVWLYQYQQQASTAAVFASVLVASIPTLVIFLFAQRIIMRGIVVPTEK